MFHIYSKIHEWFCTLKTMNGRSLWINGLFSRPNGLTRCIFFHSFHSWKNMQLVSPFGLSKRPFIHTDQPFIVFFVQSFIFFIMNVEKEQTFELNLFFYFLVYKQFFHLLIHQRCLIIEWTILCLMPRKLRQICMKWLVQEWV